MGDASVDRGGLRERKKRATRQALARAALQLAIERGPENVLVGDIAAAAGVAPRTFNHYFASKDAAIVAEGADRAQVLLDALRGRPDDEPLWNAVRAAVRELFGTAEPDRQWVVRAQLVKSSPALRIEQQRSDLAVQAMLATEVARRTRTDAEVDLYPRLAATATMSAVRAAIDHWLTAPPDHEGSLPSAVDGALELLTTGLPEPGRTSTAHRRLGDDERAPEAP